MLDQSLCDKTRVKGMCKTMVANGIVCVEVEVAVPRQGSRLAPGLNGLLGDSYADHKFPRFAPPPSGMAMVHDWVKPLRFHFCCKPNSGDVADGVFEALNSTTTYLGQAVTAAEKVRCAGNQGLADGAKRGLWMSVAYQKGGPGSCFRWHRPNQPGPRCLNPTAHYWVLLEKINPAAFAVNYTVGGVREDVMDAMFPEWKLTPPARVGDARPGVVRVVVSFDPPPVGKQVLTVSNNPGAWNMDDEETNASYNLGAHRARVNKQAGEDDGKVVEKFIRSGHPGRKKRALSGAELEQVSDLPCDVRREGGQSLVIGGSSLVILEGKACNPL